MSAKMSMFFVTLLLERKRFAVTMERIGCWPNTVTYNVLIEALCKVRAFNEIEKVLGETRMKGSEHD